MNAWMQAPWVKILILLGSVALAALIIYALRIVLTPFLVALALAYLLDPVVDGLERLRVPRSGAIVLLLVGILGGMTAVALVIYPTVRLQVETLAHEMPRYVATVQAWLTPVIERVSGLDLDGGQELLQEISRRFEGVPLQILQSLSLLLGSTLASLRGIFSAALNLLVIPVATFYFLRDLDRIRTAFPTFLPRTYRSWIMAKLADIDALLSGFVRGQLTVALILMVLYAIGLSIVGTPSSLLLGILTGAASIIPFMGLVVGFLPSLVLTFLRFHDWQHPTGVVVVFAVIQLIEGNFITPKIVGERLGLHPVVVLMAVLVGGHLFGFLGILLAVPTIAVIKVFWRDVLTFYRAI